MTINSAAIADISLNDIFYDRVQMYLKNDAVLWGLVQNYTDRVIQGDVTVDIPKLSGGTAGNVPEDGSEVASAGMGIGVDALALDQWKQFSEYIYDLARGKTRANLDGYFAEVAPSHLGDLVEAAVYAQLKSVSAAAPDHIQQLSGAGNILPTIGDIFTIAELLDDAKVPKTDRYVAVGNAFKYALMQDDNILDASKSMSNSALVKGEFSEIAGMKLVASNNVTAIEMVGFHRSHVAFAWGKSISFEKERHASKFRDFLSLSTNYGAAVLDGGQRGVLFNATGA